MNDAAQDTGQTLDLDAATAYLAAHLEGFDGPISAQKFDVGQSNPTFLLRTAAKNYVLRRKPPGKLLKSAHAVDREFRVQSALADTDVPVPKMHLLCEDDAVIGSAFYVMEHIAGRNFGTPSMEGETQATRRHVMDQMNKVLAALHTVDLDAVGLADYGAPGHYFERQLGRWSKQYRASELQDIPAMNRLIARLTEETPTDDGQRTLVHGDYRIDNLIFDKTSADCLAVLDWELSTTGHPYADLAAVIMHWQMPMGQEGRGLAGADRDALGLPTDAAFIERYCARRNLAQVADFPQYLALSFFRMAAIIQGVLKRAADGNASNPERAKQIAGLVPVFAEKGLEALDQPS